MGLRQEAAARPNRLRSPVFRVGRSCHIGPMRLYLAHGLNPLDHVSQALLVLARDEEDARGTIAHEVKGFRIGDITTVKDYPKLEARPAVVARITLLIRRADRANPGSLRRSPPRPPARCNTAPNRHKPAPLGQQFAALVRPLERSLGHTWVMTVRPFSRCSQHRINALRFHPRSAWPVDRLGQPSQR